MQAARIPQATPLTLLKLSKPALLSDPSNSSPPTIHPRKHWWQWHSLLIFSLTNYWKCNWKKDSYQSKWFWAWKLKWWNDGGVSLRSCVWTNRFAEVELKRWPLFSLFTSGLGLSDHSSVAYLRINMLPGMTRGTIPLIVSFGSY